MGSPRTEPPLAPPFPVGTRLRYRGNRQVFQLIGRANGRDVNVMILGPGLEVTITEVRAGYQGSGHVVDSDDAEVYYDETRDGSSVYVSATGKGRLITHDYAADWEVIHGQEG